MLSGTCRRSEAGRTVHSASAPPIYGRNTRHIIGRLAPRAPPQGSPRSERHYGPRPVRCEAVKYKSPRCVVGSFRSARFGYLPIVLSQDLLPTEPLDAGHGPVRPSIGVLAGVHSANKLTLLVELQREIVPLARPERDCLAVDAQILYPCIWITNHIAHGGSGNRIVLDPPGPTLIRCFPEVARVTGDQCTAL